MDTMESNSNDNDSGKMDSAHNVPMSKYSIFIY